MTGAERGLVMLCSHLGQPDRKPLTGPQLRNTGKLVAASDRGQDRTLSPPDLEALGLSPEQSLRIHGLLQQETLLDRYLDRAAAAGCMPLTRRTPGYPHVLLQKLGQDAPGCLWYKGDPDLLNRPAVALVGSRDIGMEQGDFAREAGRQAALQGYVLVSGNARGADRLAQDSCLAFGGQVISVVADSLEDKPLRDSVLYLSLEDFDRPFSTIRALARNTIIHALADLALIAQCGYGSGGTWNGATGNLHRGLCPVCVFQDGSPAASALLDQGACGVSLGALENLAALTKLSQQRLF